ncbi:MAG: BamA/TamA family outer membrane protein [Gammaproteobacteria bacterium]
MAQAEIEEVNGRVRFGREFGNRALAWLGVSRYFGEVQPQVGPQFPALDFDGGEWTAGLEYDHLDNLFLPREGALAGIRYIRSTEALGADQDFEQVLVNGLVAGSRGRHSALAALRFNTTLDDDAPVYAVFTGGGFLNMSGFEPAELSGQHFGVATLGYRYQVGRSGFLPGYVGGTVEYGNAAQDRDDVFGDGLWNGSLYFAYDTPIGPLYLGWGWSEDRSGLLFLRLGAILGSEAIGRR